MTRYIDADATKTSVATICFINDVTESRSVFSARSIYKIVDEQQTVEAIPIEWVCNYIRERKDIPLKNRECVSDMFDAWVAYMAEKEEMEE